MIIVRFALAAVLGLAGLPGMAEESPTLRVHTYDSFASEWGPGPALKAGFEQGCGCTVEYAAADDAIAAFRRVQLEGDTTQADVIVGLDTAIAGEARASGLFAPHGVELTHLQVPGGWSDRDFVPFDFGYFAFVYDTRRLAEPPRSFADLIASPRPLRIAIQDPRSSTPGLGLVIWIATAYGDRAPEIWRGLRPHILTMTRGWSESYGLFLSGEADMVLSYSTSPAYHAVVDGDDHYAYAHFPEGHIAQIEVAGVLRSSRQQDLARRFLAYLASPEAQRLIPETNWMYPVVDLGDGLPAAFRNPGPPSVVLPVDEDTVTRDARAWVDAALRALN